MNVRIGIASIALEANTFNPLPTTLESFRTGLFLCGEEIRQLRDGHHELAGFLAGLQEQNIEAVPLLAAGAAPGGVLLAATFDELRQRLHAEIDRAGPLDGLLLAPHGAMVAENAPDADGFWLNELRQRLGSRVPIVATIDPHANLSPLMVSATNAILAYKTNPHLDQRARGREAAGLIAQAVRGEIVLQQAACFPPLAIEIERQYSAEGAYAELLEYSASLQQRPGVLSSSLVLGFPYADVPEIGAAVIVVTDGNMTDPGPLAKAFGLRLWESRHQLKSQLLSMRDAVQQSVSLPGTSCLLDMGDNVGGGSPGDCTAIFEVIDSLRAGPALGVLIDSEAATMAHAAGQGAILELSLGGKLPGTAGAPIRRQFRVSALSNGRFSESETRHGGQKLFDQGLSAVLESDQLTFVVISRRVPPFSLQQVLHLGVDPASYRLVVAKGVHAPVAAYAPVCARMLRVNTPGITSAEMANLTYHHRRRPLFPCEPETSWSSLESPAICSNSTVE